MGAQKEKPLRQDIATAFSERFIDYGFVVGVTTLPPEVITT